MALTLFEDVTWDRIVDTCCTYIPEGGLDCEHSTLNMTDKILYVVKGLSASLF